MKDKNLGIVTVGYGSEHERKEKITNMVRCEFSDHRLVTVAKTEEYRKLCYNFEYKFGSNVPYCAKKGICDDNCEYMRNFK